MKRSDFVDNNMVFRILSDHAGWIATDCVNLHDVIQERDTDYQWTVTAVSPTQITVVRYSQSFTFPIYKDGSSVTSSPDDTKQTSPVTGCTAHIKHQCYRDIIATIRAVYDDVSTWPKDCRSCEALMVEIQAAILERMLGECSDE